MRNETRIVVTMAVLLFVAALFGLATGASTATLPVSLPQTIMAAAPVPVTGEILRFNKGVTDVGANEIIAGETGYKFLIITCTVTSCSDTEDTYYLSSGSEELWYTVAMPKAIDQMGISGYQGISLFPFAGGHFLTETGEDFTINLTAGEDTNVMGTYMVVK